MKSLLAVASLCGLFVGCTEDGNQRADKVGNTIVGQSLARGKDSVCMDNLRQIRYAIETQMSADETPPADLSTLKIPKEMLVDPIDKRPYDYDAAAGKVRCTHPGHERY